MAKTLPNGKPNPAFYEELVEYISKTIPTNKKPTIEKCVVCKTEPCAMYDFKKNKWYMECCCTEYSDTLRDFKDKTIVAWNVIQSIKRLEQEGLNQAPQLD